MTHYRRSLALAAVLATAGATTMACAPPQQAKPTCLYGYAIIHETEHDGHYEYEATTCNIPPRDKGGRLDVIMDLHDQTDADLQAARDRCDHMGGADLIWYEDDHVLVCEDVDF